jgi:multidrug efflux pump subunit AcrA (membrane-fusion protein)
MAKAHLDQSAVDVLGGEVRGGLVQPSEGGYDDARALYNAMIAPYPVTIDFTTDNNQQFWVGTTVAGAIATVLKTDVLEVPVRAVTTTNNKAAVTIALDGKANGRTETRTVTTGQSAGGMIEITGGLQEGDQVVVVTVVPTGLTNGGFNGTGNRGTFPGGGQFPGVGNRGSGTSGNAGTANGGSAG